MSPVLTRAALVALLAVACDAPSPRIVEVEAPGDTRDPAGPYQVTTTTRGQVDEVVIGWRTGAGAEGVADSRRLSDGRWVGGVPGQPRGTQVFLSVVARGPGGSARFPGEGEHAFEIRAEGGACRVDGECLDDEICDRLRGVCKLPPETCADDGDCGQDYVCPAPGSRCRFRPSTCDEDADCGAGLVCRQGVCITPPDCEIDADCGGGAACIDGRCVGRDECRVDRECPPERPSCTSGRCVAELPCGGDCPPGTACVDGECQPQGDCPDAPCARGQRCVPALGRCVECAADGHCGAGAHCDLDTFTCAPGRRGDVCVPCGPRGDCGADHRCVEEFGFCVAPCDGRRCPDGFECQGGFCVPFEFCGGFECRGDLDCDSQVCQSGLCEPRQFCSGDGDCADDRRCVDGRCVPRADGCSSPFDCPDGNICVGGRCEPGRAVGACQFCDEPADCPSAAFCGDVDGLGERRCVTFCDANGCPDGLECFVISGGSGVCLRPESGGCLGDGPQPDCGADFWEPNDDPDQPGFLGPGEAVEAVTCAQDPDWYFFEADAPDAVLNVATGGPIFVRLYDPGVGLFAEWFVEAEERLPLEGAPAGYIEVQGVEGRDTVYLLRFDRDQPPPACADDNLEENDDIDQAFGLRSGADVGAVACPDDLDWYAFPIFEDEQGRVLLDSGGRRLRYEVWVDPFGPVDGGVARGGQLIEIPGSPEGRALLGVWCEDCERAPVDYRLQVDIGGAEVCEDDRLEPNDRRDDAWALDIGFDGRLTVCAASEDWFVVDKAEGQALAVSVEFSHGLGDIDLFVEAENGRFTNSSTGVGDREQVVVPERQRAGRYFVRVYLLGATSNTYRLQVEGG